ncbi:MAG: YdcF family protein [Pseudonocardiaceae bacterium]
MITAGSYDLIAILAGDKAHRHPPARVLLALGWADHITVTGEHETVDLAPETGGRVLVAPPSRSTHEDARAIRSLVEEHGFRRVLVVTAASHVPRARLTIAHEFRGRPIIADILSWEQVAHPPGRAGTVSTHIQELIKLIYYALRGRA